MKKKWVLIKRFRVVLSYPENTTQDLRNGNYVKLCVLHDKVEKYLI